MIVLRAAFCWHCKHHSEQLCYDSLEVLPTRKWHDILDVSNNILYLSPKHPEHEGRSLADLANATIHGGRQSTLWQESQHRSLAFRG